MNKPPYKNNQEAIRDLKANSPAKAFYLPGADAFGTSPNVNGWHELVIKKEYINEVSRAAKKLGIELFDPTCSDIYGVHRKISMEHQMSLFLAQSGANTLTSKEAKAAAVIADFQIKFDASTEGGLAFVLSTKGGPGR